MRPRGAGHRQEGVIPCPLGREVVVAPHRGTELRCHVEEEARQLVPKRREHIVNVEEVVGPRIRGEGERAPRGRVANAPVGHH